MGTKCQGNVPPSPSFLTAQAKKQARREATIEFHKTAPNSYKELEIRPHTKASRITEHGLSRLAYSRLVAARTGHGDFKEYHERFGHTDAELDCSCGRPKTPTHFFSCNLAKARWKRRWKPPSKLSPRDSIEWVLTNPQGAEAFEAFCTETKFFEEICPSRPRNPRP